MSQAPVPRIALFGAVTMVVIAGSLSAHDLVLKLDSYFLPPHTPVRVTVLNGTFTKREGALARDRIQNLILIGPAGRQQLDTAAITAHHDTSDLHLRTGEEGTYVLGLSVRPREIALTGKQFNEYLKEEGIENVLAQRAQTGMLEEPAIERYAKHVKALFQVGTVPTPTASTVLGYVAEIVPLDNPYGLTRGGTLRLRCLIDGQPAGYLVVVGGGVGPRRVVIKETRTRTDSAGVARLPMGTSGRWYAKFVKMRRSTLPGVDYESQWATLTFEVR